MAMWARRGSILQHLLCAHLMSELLLEDRGPWCLASDEPNTRKVITAWRHSYNHATWECQADSDTQGPCPTPHISLQASSPMAQLASPGDASGCWHSSSFWQLYHWPDDWPRKEHSPVSPCQKVRQLPLFAKCCQTFLPYLAASSCTYSFFLLWFPYDKLVTSP